MNNDQRQAKLDRHGMLHHSHFRGPQLAAAMMRAIVAAGPSKTAARILRRVRHEQFNHVEV